MLGLLLILYGFIIVLEVPTLLRKRMFRELVVFSAFMALAVYLSLAQLYDWYLPNPLQAWIARAAAGY